MQLNRVPADSCIVDGCRRLFREMIRGGGDYAAKTAI
jgi:hypothetical protein